MSSYYANFYTTPTDMAAVSMFGVLYYGSLIILVVFLILVFVNFTVYPIFALTPNDPGIILISGTSDRELAYTLNDGNPPVPANARNKKITRTTLPSCSYTIGADVYINDTIKTTYPLPIFYRDMSPVSSTDAALATEMLSDTYQNTDIIVWTDPDTKEIQVTLVTISAIDGSIIEKSMDTPIQPIIKKTFRLTIVFADSFAEVYINGALRSTINTANSLKSIPETDFYPPVVTPDIGGVSIANMAMWPRLLTSKEIRAYEAGPMGDAGPKS
jgi:hypothetical protein